MVPAPGAPGGVPTLVKFKALLARLPTTVVLPLTVRLPVRFREKALIPPVEEMLLKVGAEGSLGRITLGICLVTIPGPLISSSYLPGAA